VRQVHSPPALARWLKTAALSFAIALCVVAIMHLAFEVQRKLAQLDEANSDNVQWTLSQVEVEFMRYRLSLEAARSDSPEALAAVRQRFDVFYSRIKTISTGAIYAPLDADRVFGAARLEITGMLDAAIPAIDGTDPELRTALPQLVLAAEAVQPQVRAMSLSGLKQFAQQSDSWREGVAVTLGRLAGLTAGLVLALSMLSVMLLRLSRVSDQHAAEARSSAGRLEKILSTSLDAVLVTDRAGIVRDVNGAAEQVFGYSRQEAVGRPMAELIVPPHLRVAHENGMRRYRETGKRKVLGRGRVEMEAMRRGGEVFPVELSLDTTEHGDEELFVSFIRDITLRKRSEAELVEARDRALAGEKAKAEFVAVMSHEIRTPLNGLLGTLTLLRDTRLSTEQGALIDDMDASGRLLLSQVNDVLEISRLEAGRVELRRVSFDLPALLDEIVSGQKALAVAHGDKLTHNQFGDLPDTWVGDPVRLRQILLNLVGNAVKFTRNGSVTLEVESLHADGRRHELEFRVIDTGIGIAEENLERVFRDFETLDTTYGRATGGAGLGLAIARRMTEAMDGEIGVESEPGEGSLFWVRLPMEAHAAQIRTPESDPARDKRESRPLEVLVVEDNRINRTVLRSMLERDGHRVTEAHDGEEGVALAQRQRYDVILMDVSMPVMDGIAATRAIRASDGKSREVPIFAVTAHALEDEIHAFCAAGMDGLVVKPISRETLRETLRAPRRLSDTSPPGTAPAAALPLLDRRKLSELEETVGKPALSRLVERFIRELDEEVTALSGDTDATCRNSRAHRMAGACATVGAQRLHCLLSEVQTAAKRGQKEAVGSALPEIVATWAQTREACLALDVRAAPVAAAAPIPSAPRSA